MTYRGHVKNGVIELDESVELPEGAEVAVEVRSATGEEESVPPTLYERFERFIGVVEDMPADLAQNHDHYLYGVPKK